MTIASVTRSLLVLTFSISNPFSLLAVLDAKTLDTPAKIKSEKKRKTRRGAGSFPLTGPD